MDKLQLGQIVRSTAGRDKNQFYVIVDYIQEDSDWYFLADGDIRKISKPKKKNIKHIAKTNMIDTILSEKLNSNVKIQDSELRMVLDRYNYDYESN